MITLTEKAIAQIKAIIADEKFDHSRLRVKVSGGGCAGFKYDIYFDDLLPTEMDEVYEYDGINVIVDPLSLQYIDGTQIDFVKLDFGEGFKFENPNVEATCGCGSSFKV